MNNIHDPLTGAREIADGVFVFTSGAYAMNSGIVLQAAREDGGARAQGGVRADAQGRAGAAGGANAQGEERAIAGAGRSTAATPGDGCGALLVDPGYFPAEIERIAAFLDRTGQVAGRVLLTHSDWDHVAGAGRWPAADVVASAEYPGRAAAERERIVRSLEDFDRRLYVQREPPFSIPEPGVLAGSPSDLVWSGPRARLLPAGGHTADGLMLLLRDSRVLFAGDHLSDREIPFVGDSFAAYRQTLLRVRNLAASGEAETLVPGHGEICGRVEILARVDEDEDYIERLTVWVRETSRSVGTLAGLLDRADEVVFRKGCDNPDVVAEHRSNVTLASRLLGIT